MRTYRRLALVVISTVSTVALVGGASISQAAPGQHNARRPICKIHSLRSFIESGEGAQHSSVADIVQVECQPRFAEQTVTISADELLARCDGLSWSKPFPLSFVEGATFTTTLDNEGNATAALWAGPSCAAGPSHIFASLDAPPFPTVSTIFTVLPPRVTPPGVKARPRTEVEDATWSSVATIIYVEFPPVFSQKYVKIRSHELFTRCQGAPGLVWVGPNEVVQGTAVDNTTVQLDNNGDAFVVVLAGWSCAAGTSTVSASLTTVPFTTYTTTFRILPPQPTV